MCGGVSGVPKRTGVWKVAAGMVADLAVDEYPPERCISSKRSIRGGSVVKREAERIFSWMVYINSVILGRTDIQLR